MGFAINILHAQLSDFHPTWKQKDNRKDKNTYTVIALNGKKRTN